MGSNQSSRQSHFQRPVGEEDTFTSGSAEKLSEQEEFADNQEHHISISNKMVERLVEDAALEGGAAAAAAAAAAATGANEQAFTRTEQRDRIYAEKLRKLDDEHSKKFGLTIEDANALARRIELRNAIVLAPTPVCEDCKDRVIQCYNAGGDSETAAQETFRCWSTVDAFTACVADACATRLRASTAREAREAARRSLQVTHAREHSLRELRNKPNIPA